jgi:hypothetical protein
MSNHSLPSAWKLLDAELSCLEEAGRVATLWWRDDDAVSDTPPLRQLCELSATHGIPNVLAVIPALVDPTLAGVLAPYATIMVATHGYAHVNNAPERDKKSEFGVGANIPERLEEAAAGRAILEQMFSAQSVNLFVPPWNRVHHGVTAGLAVAGFEGLSTFKSRDALFAAPGLKALNTHVDIIDWRGARGFAGECTVLNSLVAHLRQRRMADGGSHQASEPTGVLTHHMNHDAGCWKFLEQLFERTSASRCVKWLGGHELMM